jgi:hypothetical protein
MKYHFNTLDNQHRMRQHEVVPGRNDFFFSNEAEMTKPTDKQPTRINIELPANLEATYANLTIINHSASEIILDFAQVMPNQSKSKVQSRVVMTPLNAKLFLRALTENLQRYETRYGEINIPENIVIDPNRGFSR